MVTGSVRRLHSGIVTRLRLWLVCPAFLLFSFSIYFPVFHHYWKVYNILALKLSLKMPRSIFCVKLRVVVFKNAEYVLILYLEFGGHRSLQQEEHC